MANWKALIPSEFKPSGFISYLRAFLGRRDFKPNVRMTYEVSSATQPPPDVPGGPHHKVNNNYYYARDARREVQHPAIIVENSTNMINAAKNPEIGSTSPSKLPLPGKVYLWD